MSFARRLLERHAEPWRRMLSHPFLAETAAGTIPDARFAHWLRQDYLFVREAVPVLALLIPKAPVDDRPMLANAIVGLHRELELFESMAAERGVELADVRPEPTNLSYASFLKATAAIDPYELGFTVLFAAEKAYLDAWSEVRRRQTAPSPWQAFIENWTSEAFAGWVATLGSRLDALAAEASARLREGMDERFRQTVEYEIAFWDLAYAAG